MIVPALVSLVLAQTPATPPKVGEKPPAFDLLSLDEKPVRLAPLLDEGSVVLVVLRGYPGYQCPLCTRQVGELIGNSKEFAKRKASVVLVYPGPSENLKKYAAEFVSGGDVPRRFYVALDPGYRLIESYGLRWNAPGETAYPSTFVIARNGRVAYAKISRSHGDRAPIAEILTNLGK